LVSLPITENDHSEHAMLGAALPMKCDYARYSTAPKQRHISWHQSDELNIRIQRKAGHPNDGISRVLYVHSGFGHDCAVRLQNTGD
jgi:hypothetical protein